MRLTCIQFLERFQLLDESFILIFKHGYSVLQALDILFLLSATFSRSLSVLEKSDLSLSVINSY